MTEKQAGNSFLSHYKILDLSQYIPGPYATRQLADLGADVIKIEPLAGDPMRHFMFNPKPPHANKSKTHAEQNYSPIYQHLNRGKRIVKIDLKQATGKEALSNLLKNADVLLESFRPGVMAKLGFDRETLKTINPKLVHCALSGFGQNGPYEQRAGHDLTYSAVSGVLGKSNGNKKPRFSFPPIADHAGAMQASNTILAALLNRERTGKGAFIDISLYESSLAWQYLTFNDDETLPEDQRESQIVNGGTAYYNIYQTSDARFIALAPIEPKFWLAFCEAVAKPQWLERQSDSLPQTSLIKEISDLFSTKSLSYWNNLFKDVDCCYEPILMNDEVAKHPQVIARHSLDGDQPRYPAWINNSPVFNKDTIREIDDNHLDRNNADEYITIKWLS